ncbi:MAG: hypothetical protein M1434_09200, partial [Chloroflexi bacterium]|nr:hypothetical protein [Chloroflexota bacterium]
NVSLPQACVGLAADWRISYPCAPLSCPTPSIIFGGSLAPASECTQLSAHQLPAALSALLPTVVTPFLTWLTGILFLALLYHWLIPGRVRWRT